MRARERVLQLFKHSEDIIYTGIGIMLVLTAVLLLVFSATSIVEHLGDQDHVQAALHVLDRMLLTLMFIEILYTVRISITSHSLCAEPFLIVGLIAAIRRILVISVEGTHMPERFTDHMVESGVLGALILVFVIAIVLLRKNGPTPPGSTEKEP